MLDPGGLTGLVVGRPPVLLAEEQERIRHVTATSVEALLDLAMSPAQEIGDRIDEAGFGLRLVGRGGDGELGEQPFELVRALGEGRLIERAIGVGLAYAALQEIRREQRTTHVALGRIRPRVPAEAGMAKSHRGLPFGTAVHNDQPSQRWHMSIARGVIVSSINTQSIPTSGPASCSYRLTQRLNRFVGPQVRNGRVSSQLATTTLAGPVWRTCGPLCGSASEDWPGTIHQSCHAI